MQAAGSVIFRWLNQEKFIISGFTAGLLIVKITANEKKKIPVVLCSFFGHKKWKEFNT